MYLSVHACMQVVPKLQTYMLPPGGGASNVAESVVVFAKEKGASLVVLGSRGMGAVKSTLMSMAGLGSVSSYCAHHLHCPLAVARGRMVDATPKVRQLMSILHALWGVILCISQDCNLA